VLSANATLEIVDRTGMAVQRQRVHCLNVVLFYGKGPAPRAQHQAGTGPLRLEASLAVRAMERRSAADAAAATLERFTQTLPLRF